MYCPECGGEYREGFTHCKDCGVALTAEPPAAEAGPRPDLELVDVWEVADPGRLALAESLLMEAEIPYVKKNEHVQDLFAGGRLFPMPVVGPVRLAVAREDAEAAQELLAGIDSEDLESSYDEEDEPE